MSGGGGGGGGSRAPVNVATQGRDSSLPAYGSKTISPPANHYVPTYAPMQQSSQQPSTQETQQQTPQETVQAMGLQALYQSMVNQFAPISQQFNGMDQFYQQPVQQQMPTYQNPALNYRPDMSSITTNLNRVAPSVALQQQRAAEEEARRAAEKAANVPPGYYGGGD